MTIHRLAPITPIRPGVPAPAGYGDTDAMNDIHALLNGSSGLAAGTSLRQSRRSSRGPGGPKRGRG